MTPTLAVVLGALAALLHVYIFWMESVAWRRPVVWRRFGIRDQETADTIAPMAYNQGFYNLFLAIGVAAGLVLWRVAPAPWDTAGYLLTLVGLGSMVAAALVLVTSDRSKLRAALIQGLIPAVALALMLWPRV